MNLYTISFICNQSENSEQQQTESMFTAESGKKEKERNEKKCWKKIPKSPVWTASNTFSCALHATGGNLVFFSLTRGKWRSMSKESLPLRYGESREIQSTNQGTLHPLRGAPCDGRVWSVNCGCGVRLWHPRKVRRTFA